jgi:RNA polymerase sigma-70 factor (ECF subfamily)
VSISLNHSTEFEALFKSHYAMLVGYARKLLHEQEQAEDVVQQLFVNLWEKRESIEVGGSWKSYLLRSTHNSCLNQIKHQKIKTEHVQHSLATEAISEQRDLLEEQEFNQKVKHAVQSLPPQCKKIFLMSRLQGKKYNQIANELNLSVKTIENQMGKALKVLREELKTQHSPTLNVIKTIFWFIIGVNLFSIVMK